MDTDTEEDVPMKNAAARSPKGRRLSPKSRDRAGVKTLDLRRPVRPVDREKMRPWLKNHLDSGTVFGLKWLKKEDGTFQVSWRHASRLGWKLETDGDVFEKWARHTGIYKDGDEPEPKRWKANFRCAIHSLPDVRELTDPVERRGHNANRTYRFLQPEEIGTQVKRKSSSVQPAVRPEPERYEAEEQPTVEDSEDSSSQQADSDDKNDDEDDGEQYREIYVLPQSDHDYAVRIERKDGEESSVKIVSEHGSGFVLIKTKKPSNLPTTLAEALDITHSLEHRRPVQRSAPPSSKWNLKAGKKGSAASKGKGRLSVNTRALISGKKTPCAKTLGHGAEDGRRVGIGKRPAFSLLARNREHPTESGAGSPSQTLGFDALLAAANMARMDTLTSPAASTTASATTAATSWAASTSACPPATSVPSSASYTTHTVCQEFPNAVTSNVAEPVRSEAESRVIQIHPEMTEATFPSHSPLTSAQSTLVFNILQNLLGSSPVSAVLPPEVSLASGSGQSSSMTTAQVKNSSSLTSNTPTVQLCGNATGAARKTQGPNVGISDSFYVGSSVKEGSRLKALLHQVGNQTVTAVPNAATLAASGASTSSVTLTNATSVSSSSKQRSDRTVMPSVSEIKREPPVPNVTCVKVENVSWTEIEHVASDGPKKCEQVGLHAETSIKVEKNLSPNRPEEEQSSKTGSIVSPPAASVQYPQFSAPTGHNSDLLQSKFEFVQTAPSVVKVGRESSVPVPNANSSQAVPAPSHTPATSSSSQGLNAGSQAPATTSHPQTFNMGPVFVVNPSIVLTLPQTSTSASQPEGTSVVTLPFSDLQDLFNMCFSGGAQQVLHNAEPVPVNNAHIPDSTVSDSVLLATGEDAGLSSTGVESSGQVAVSASGGEHELPSATISQSASFVSAMADRSNFDH